MAKGWKEREEKPSVPSPQALYLKIGWRSRRDSALTAVCGGSLQLERTEGFVCLFVLDSCCLFALVIGSDQKVLKSTRVFVKGLSNVVWRIGNNKEKQKFSCSCSTEFGLLNKWLYVHKTLELEAYTPIY